LGPDCFMPPSGTDQFVSQTLEEALTSETSRILERDVI